MSYVPVGWKNYPDKTTPVNADNLNKMEKGILDAHTMIGDTSQIADMGDGTLAGAIAEQNNALGGKATTWNDENGGLVLLNPNSGAALIFNNIANRLTVTNNGFNKDYVFSDYAIKTDVNYALNSKVPFLNCGDGGFKTVAFSKRNFTGTTMIDVINEYISNALLSFGSNISFSGNIYAAGIIDGYICGNVWGDADGAIHSACAFVMSESGYMARYYKRMHENPTIDELASRSSMYQNLFYVFTIYDNNENIPANSTTEFNHTSTTVTPGWYPIAVLESRVDYPHSLNVTYCAIAPNCDIRYFIKNSTNSAVTNQKTTFKVLCVNDYFLKVT